MACKQVFTSRLPNGSNSVPNYCAPTLGYQWSSASGSVTPITWLVAGTFRNVSIARVTAPGSGKSYVYTFVKNGVDTALTITIADLATTGRDVSHTVSVMPGDLVYWRRTPFGTPALSTERVTGEFWGALPYESGYSGMSAVTAANTFRTALFHPGQLNTGNGGISNHEPVAVAGTVTAYTVNLNGAPGASKQHESVIYKNGTKQDGSGGTPDTRIVISGASATSGSWTGTLTVTPGDWVYIETVPTGTPAGADWAIAVKLVATTDGESQGSGLIFNNLPSSSSPYYESPNQWKASGWDATESNVDALWDTTTEVLIRALYVSLGTNTVGTGPLTFTLRQGGADTALTCTLTVGQTGGSDLTNSFTMASGLWSLKYSFGGSPGAARTASFAFAMFAQYEPTRRGVVVLGSGVTVNVSHAVGIGADGSTHVHSESGKIKCFGHLSATGYVEIPDGIPAPATPAGAAAGMARIYIDAADGDLKIIYGDGTVKTIVVDT